MNVHAKFRCAPLRIKKALGIFRELIQEQEQLHRESKKGDTIHLSISLLNIDRFSQFFHRRTQLEICNKIINKDPASPQTCCYTTL